MAWLRHSISILLLLAIVGIFQSSVASADVLTERYQNGHKTAFLQTEVFALPIKIEHNAVYVDRRVDGVMVWYTKNTGADRDMEDSRIQKLVEAMRKYYPGAKVWTKSYNGDVDKTRSRIVFKNKGGPNNDPAFYNAVERALNELAIGKVQAKPGLAKKPVKRTTKP